LSKSQNNAKKNKKKNLTNSTNPNERTTTNYNINIKIFDNLVEKKRLDPSEDNNEVYILDSSKALLKLNDDIL
jgi:hypothetical protein